MKRGEESVDEYLRARPHVNQDKNVQPWMPEPDYIEAWEDRWEIFHRRLR